MQKAVALVGAVMVVSACESAASASLDTDEQKASYAIGRDMGDYLKPSQGRLDMDAFVRGVEDALAGSEAALPDEELQGALQRFSQAIEQDQRASGRSRPGRTPRLEKRTWRRTPPGRACRPRRADSSTRCWPRAPARVRPPRTA